MALSKTDRRERLRFRIRKTVSGTTERPRLAVFRSNKEIYAQLIDDVNGVTITCCIFKRQKYRRVLNQIK
jgi:large subunit ribosomal protein L18